MPRTLRVGFGLVLIGLVFAAARAAEPAVLRVVFTGQALVQHDLRKAAPGKFSGIVAALRGHDVVFTDLETAIQTGRGAPTRDSAFFHAAGPEAIDCLKEAGFNLLALSNNHAFDLGPEGVIGTRDAVAARGLVSAGTGPTLTAASAPALLTTPRGRVALVAFASGNNHEAARATADRAGVNVVRLDPKTGEIDVADAERVFAALRAAAKTADLVIAYQHDHYWEKDNRVTPAWKQRFARACIDAGAGVFVSHGAPMLHGIELYRGHPIFYDLGGLVFHTITAPGYYLPEVWESLLVEAEFAQGRCTAMRLWAVALNERGEGEPPSPQFYATRGLPAVVGGDQARSVFERVAKLSAAYGTRLTFESDRAVVALPVGVETR